MPTGLLVPVGTVEAPPLEVFRAGERVTFCDSNSDFLGFLLGGGDRVNVDVAGATLCVYQLREDLANTHLVITAELGERFTTALAHVYWMVEHQSDHGLLLPDCPNTFYSRDPDGIPWAVRCDWRSTYDGCHVEAHPIANLTLLRVGYRVIAQAA